MTEQIEIISYIHGKIVNALYKIGMVEVDYNEDDSIEFRLKGYTVRINIEATKKKTKK